MKIFFSILHDKIIFFFLFCLFLHLHMSMLESDKFQCVFHLPENSFASVYTTDTALHNRHITVYSCGSFFPLLLFCCPTTADKM